MDHLSEMFDLVEVRGVLSGGFVGRERWVTRGELRTPFKFFALVRGSARLITDASDLPIDLEAGDVALLNHRSWLSLEGGRGDGPPQEIRPDGHDPDGHDAVDLVGVTADSDAVVGGRIDLAPGGRALLHEALPPVAHVRGSTGSSALRAAVHRVFDEVSAGRLGSEFAIRQHTQLLLLEVVRAYVDQADLPPGWLKVLADERLRPAIDLMHGEPGRPWGLHELASAASMSRTTFADRFRTAAGLPPLTYLGRWRMLLAQRALRDREVSIGSLAAELGYTSESAFSTAFKRAVGDSPLRFRHRQRVGVRA